MKDGTSQPIRRNLRRLSPIVFAEDISILNISPQTVYVSWDLSAEAQHAACNWKYDVASRRATPLTPAEAADVAQRIIAGTVAPQERAFFHSVPKPGGRLAVSAGYCWGSASGTFAVQADKVVLTGDLEIHGY